MTAPERLSGKRGRRPARHVPELHIGRFGGPAESAPATGDVSHGITGWGMLGNDTHSCCGASAWLHYLMAKAGQTTVTLPDGRVLGADDPALRDWMLQQYFAYGRAQGEPGDQPDDGVENATWLKFLFDQGLIEGYAEVDLTNPDEARWAMLNFGGLLVGASLTDQAETEFAHHQPWDVTGTEPIDPNMGHDFVIVAYDADGETAITWGADQRCTISFAREEIAAHDGEAWVIITKEDAERTGINLDFLRSEIARFGGTETNPAPPATDTPPAVETPPPPAPEPDPNSPRGATGLPGAVTDAEHEVERIFAQAKADAVEIFDKAKADAHNLLRMVTGGGQATPPATDAPPVEGS